MWTLLMSTPGWSATIPVSEGEDLAAAIASAEPGDVLELGEGRFEACLELSEPELTLQGQGPELTTLVGEACDSLLEVHGGELQLEGMSLENPGGRGLVVEGGSHILSEVTLSGLGRDDRSGGAIWASEASLHLFDCELSDNLAYEGAGLYGFELDLLFLRGNTWTRNEVNAGHGAAYWVEGYVVGDEERVLDNEGHLYSGGSAVYVRGGGLWLEDFEVSGNGGYYGAMVVETGVEVLLERGLFSWNTGRYYYGAIWARADHIELHELEFDQNSSLYSGPVSLSATYSLHLSDSRIVSRGNDVAGVQDLSAGAPELLVEGLEVQSSGGGEGSVSLRGVSVELRDSALSGGRDYGEGLLRLDAEESRLVGNDFCGGEGALLRLDGGRHLLVDNHISGYSDEHLPLLTASGAELALLGNTLVGNATAGQLLLEEDSCLLLQDNLTDWDEDEGLSGSFELDSGSAGNLYGQTWTEAGCERQELEAGTGTAEEPESWRLECSELEDTGLDTAEPGDSDEPGDSEPPGDSAEPDSALEPQPPEREPEPTCGCASARGLAFPLLALLGLLLLRRR